MLAIATGSYDVLRGSGTNVWGDDTDAATVVASAVPMALMPAGRNRSSRADGGLREVDSFTGWAPYGANLRVDDRIRDRRTGEVYVLSVLTQPRTQPFQGDLRLECRRVAGNVVVPTSGAPAALATVAAALDNLPTGRVNIVVVGDSNAEGQGAVVAPKRWVQLLQDRLRTAYGVTGSPTVYLPTHYGGSSLSPAPATLDTSNAGATTTVDTRYGLGGRARQFAKGAFATWQGFGTSVKIHYATDAFGVNANVTIDGIARTAFSCSGGASGGLVATYAGLGEAFHTVKVQCSDLSLGFIITLEGCEFFSGDETNGLSVYDASRFGAVTDTWASSPEVAKAVASVSPTCVVYATGINDTLVYTPAQSATKLLAAKAQNDARIASAHSNVLLVHPGRGDAILAPYEDYVSAWTTAAASAGMHLVNLANYMPSKAADTAGYFADQVHYSEALGHPTVAAAMFAELTYRG